VPPLKQPAKLKLNIKKNHYELPGTNALADFDKGVTYGRKKFFNIGPGLPKLAPLIPFGNVIKLFMAASCAFL
jgi:hypothetical protein